MRISSLALAASCTAVVSLFQTACGSSDYLSGRIAAIKARYENVRIHAPFSVTGSVPCWRDSIASEVMKVDRWFCRPSDNVKAMIDDGRIESLTRVWAATLASPDETPWGVWGRSYRAFFEGWMVASADSVIASNDREIVGAFWVHRSPAANTVTVADVFRKGDRVIARLSINDCSGPRREALVCLNPGAAIGWLDMD